MKKKLLLLLLISMSVVTMAQSKRESLKEAYAVIKEYAPHVDVKLELDENGAGGEKYFETKVKDGILYIKGSSGVALCRGFYDFVKRNNYGIRTWSGSRLEMPSKLGDTEVHRVVSPFENHYYFNVVTYGYTMPYWDWERWSEEIDYMALHGIDMPLALVANEAITQRVFEKIGLTKEQISNYFTGPAHFPWMRMGNMSEKDSPLPQEWHEGQIELQHKILKKMKALGMKPICPAFAGFVPQELGELYPDVEIVETSWAGAFKNWMVSPKSELFAQIGTMFIEEWEKEFGRNGHYLADSFNEMEIPFPPVGTSERYELLTHYGENLYNSIKAANEDAIWVMQGWMFGYQREIWEPATLAALCKNVPDDKMLLLDEAVDYNMTFWHNGQNWEFYKGFYNKPWVYGTIPSMGGKSGWTGVLEFYANGHLDALNSENRGRLVGYGSAPEGIENNEVVYELIWDAGWSDKKIELREWLQDYTLQRYGVDPQSIDSSWTYLLKSVYGTFTDHPKYNWQSFPGAVRKGTINSSEDYFKGVELFASQPIENSDLFEADLVEAAAGYLGGKAEILIMQIEEQLINGNKVKARELADRFFVLMEGADRLLESHPTHRLERWIEFARAHGGSEELADYYEKNARRLITIWGPPINDYSARIWSGLIRDYYIPRYKAYFKSRIEGDSADYEALRDWEVKWVERRKGVSVIKPFEDVISAAQELIESNSDITAEGLPEMMGYWLGKNDGAKLVMQSSVGALKEGKCFRVLYTGGKGEYIPVSLTFVLDGKEYMVEMPQNLKKLNSENTVQIIPFQFPEGATANNSCVVVMRGEGEISGRFELVKGEF